MTAGEVEQQSKDTTSPASPRIGYATLQQLLNLSVARGFASTNHIPQPHIPLLEVQVHVQARLNSI
jgi:hypothetical protein